VAISIRTWDIEAEGVPDAISNFARKADAATREGVRADMKIFLGRYHDQAAEEFSRRFGQDFVPAEIGQSIEEFSTWYP